MQILLSYTVVSEGSHARPCVFRLIFQYLNQRPLKFDPIETNYTMSPTHNAPNLRITEGVPEFDTMRLG